MKKILIIVLYFITSWNCAQVPNTDELRKHGYQAKQEGNYELSIKYYEKILSQESNDYDATLALARLYTLQTNYGRSVEYYNKLLSNDPKDWEALYGIGDCHLKQGNLDEAIFYYSKAVKALPDYVPGYLALAKAYSWNGNVDVAISIYNDANEQDPTYSQTWAGLGRMHYWNGLPYTAIKYYKKALDLDPENEAIKNEYKKIQQDIKNWVSGQFRYFQEKEESYIIDALIQQYTFSKRFSDHWKIQINSLLDYSDRDFFSLDEDTTRWFQNNWVKVSWISENHRISIHTGYSPTDDLWSSYGLSWKMTYKWGDFGLINSFDGGYDYFYYWNNVGRHIIKESLQLSWKRLEANLGITAGQIDEMKIRKYKDQEYQIGNNPILSYSFSLNYKVLKNPEIKIGGQHSFLDYEYQSPLYYSPYDRKLSGIMSSVLKKFKHWYFYSGFIYNIGTETYYYLSDQNGIYESGTTDVDNWSVSMEIGYTKPSFSVSLSGSRFKNPYYENWIGFINLSKSF